MKRVWIGTSGWVYKEWAGNFYPEGWPKRKEFDFYTRHFPTVEINATFYRLPTVKTVQGWHDRAPPGFVYAVKGSRYLTHIRRLRDTSAGLRKYFRRLEPLADRCGPILWQLPPNFLPTEENRERLEHFLGRLPRRYRHAVEFRHPGWFDETTFSLLRRHGAANVWLSSQRMPPDHTITADFVYLRFHGLEGGAWHDYTTAELRPWAQALARAAARGLSAFVYFNNDLNTRAPLNAEALRRLVGPHAVPALHPEVAGRRTRIGKIAAPVPKPEAWPDTWGSQRRPKPRASSKKRKPAAARKAAPTRRRARRTPAPPRRFSRPAAAAISSSPRRPLG